MDNEPLLKISGPANYGIFNVYRHLRVMLTENCNKSQKFVNGQTGIVKLVRGKTILVQIKLKQLIIVYPITNDTITYYPLRPNYATTIFKSQGQNLAHATVWFDIDTVAPGTAYVAISRVQYMKDLLFLRKPEKWHFKAV